MPNHQRVELQMPFQPEYLPLATGCVEQAVQAYGMGRGEAMHLALAVEEVYSFLASRTASGQRLRLSCRFAGYYAEVVCRFQRGGLPMEAFNITATVSSDDEKSLEEMGLLLAARTVDQLRISAEEAEMGIHFIKEKIYPPAQERLTDFAATEPFRLAEPEPELLKQFAVRVCSRYGAKTPPPFQYPGKLADMVRFGEYGAVLLVDGKGNLGGGMLWHCRNKMAEAYGPSWPDRGCFVWWCNSRRPSCRKVSSSRSMPPVRFCIDNWKRTMAPWLTFIRASPSFTRLKPVGCSCLASCIRPCIKGRSGRPVRRFPPG